MADLQQKVLHQPKFWVGIRYGMGSRISSGPLSQLPFDVRATTKNVQADELTTTWGANDPAAGPDVAIPLYERFATAVRSFGLPTATGRFGADMQVELVNDGPVTLIVDTQ